MSIKSLFENIADAIKDKNPNIANVTPVEMPSAIRSIPSGSSTAGGVTYDNTASRLTANNVQDAIDELAEDVSTIYSDLSEINSNLNPTIYTLNLNGSIWNTTKLYFVKSGHTVMVSINKNLKNAYVNTYTTLGTLPDEYKPIIFTSGAVFSEVSTNAGNNYEISIETDGTVKHYGYGTAGAVISSAKSIFTYIAN